LQKFWIFEQKFIYAYAYCNNKCFSYQIFKKRIYNVCMADDPAVQQGAIVNPEPDMDEILERSEDGDEHDPLAEGGGEVMDIGKDENGPEELNTTEDLIQDAEED
jgi:hypothetical protein